MKLIDTLRQDVENIKDNQKKISENVQKVISFMKNIDLQQVDGSEGRDDEYSELEMDEDLENYNDDYGAEDATKASEKSKPKSHKKQPTKKKSDDSVSIDDEDFFD